jgi:hypothetical protein
MIISVQDVQVGCMPFIFTLIQGLSRHMYSQVETGTFASLFCVMWRVPGLTAGAVLAFGSCVLCLSMLSALQTDLLTVAPLPSLGGSAFELCCFPSLV